MIKLSQRVKETYPKENWKPLVLVKVVKNKFKVEHAYYILIAFGFNLAYIRKMLLITFL